MELRYHQGCEDDRLYNKVSHETSSNEQRQLGVQEIKTPENLVSISKKKKPKHPKSPLKPNETTVGLGSDCLVSYYKNQFGCIRV